MPEEMMILDFRTQFDSIELINREIQTHKHNSQPIRRPWTCSCACSATSRPRAARTSSAGASARSPIRVTSCGGNWGPCSTGEKRWRISKSACALPRFQRAPPGGHVLHAPRHRGDHAPHAAGAHRARLRARVPRARRARALDRGAHRHRQRDHPPGRGSTGSAAEGAGVRLYRNQGVFLSEGLGS